MAFQSIRITGFAGRTSYSHGIAFTYSGKTKTFTIRLAEDVCEQCGFKGKTALDLQFDPDTKRFRLYRNADGNVFRPQGPPPKKPTIAPPGHKRGRPPLVATVAPPPPPPVEDNFSARKYLRIAGSMRLDLKTMEVVFGPVMDMGKTLNAHAVQIEAAEGLVDFTLAPGKHSLV